MTRIVEREYIVDTFSNFEGMEELVALPISPSGLFSFMIDFCHEPNWSPGTVGCDRIAWDPARLNFAVTERAIPVATGTQFRQINAYYPSFNPAYLARPTSLLARMVYNIKIFVFKKTLTPNIFEVTDMKEGERFTIKTIVGIFPFTMEYMFLPVDTMNSDRTRLVIEMRIFPTTALRVLALVPGFRSLLKRKLRDEMVGYVAALSVRPWESTETDYKAKR
jgi:hypothetical protein